MTTTAHTIDPTSSVNDVVRRYPQTLRLLVSRGIDVCCDGGLPLSVAAADANVDLSVLLIEIAEALGAESGVAR